MQPDSSRATLFSSSQANPERLESAAANLEGKITSRHLLAHKDQIIQRWVERVRSDLPHSQQLSEPLILDTLPIWLDQLSQVIESPAPQKKIRRLLKTSKIHSETRIRTDFDLSELLYEYILLRQVIFEVMEQDQVMLPRERDLILDAIQVSMMTAAAEYFQLQFRQKRQKFFGLTTPKSAMIRFLLTLAILGITTLLVWLMRSFVSPAVYYLYLPGIILASFFGHGIVAIVLSILAVDYFFTTPLFSFTIATWDELIRAILFGATAYLISSVTNHLRISQMISQESLLNQQKSKREAEEAAEREKESRAEVEKINELLRTLISTISHDLRGPLTAAKINVQMLELHPERTDLRNELPKRIRESINRMNQMIEDLLDTSRIQAGKKIPIQISHCNLAQIVRAAIVDLSTVFGDRFVLNSPDSVEGYWSPQGIHRVIENLCDNAVKYGSPDSLIHIGIQAEAQWVKISVQNEGSYISPEQKENLFKLFHRADLAEISGKKGWGIGLTIVQGIVEAHGGRIDIQSEPNQGTTFIIELPRDARLSQI